MTKILKSNITILIIIFSLFSMPITVFCKEEIVKENYTKDFLASISKVNEKIAAFGEKLNKTEIGNINKAVPASIETLPLKEYIIDRKSFMKTYESSLKGKPDIEIHSAEFEFERGIKEWLLNEFNNFYKEIAPILKDIGQNLKNSPIRLSEISLDIAPFGIGGSLNIEINYESSIFKEDKSK